MDMKWYNFVAFLALAIFSTNAQNSTFNAAVVNYSPIYGNSSVNAEEYVKIIAQLKSNTTDQIDLIVFPEMSLNLYETLSNTTATFLPSGNNSADVLCNSTSSLYADFLKTLSCAAVSHSVNLVVNLWEKQNCTGTNCTNGLVYYNTNVVLNSNGTVTAVYRKWNLFNETGISQPSEVEVVTFQIQNVTFGMFTCFDILFYEPALNLTRNLTVKNIVFPNMWFGELPFLTALQVQQMWAYENDVLLLASGASLPQVGSGGSGIFVGSDGALDLEINSGNTSTVLYHNVPNLEIANTSASRNVSNSLESDETIDTAAKSMDDFALMVDSSIANYSSKVLNTTQTANITEQVCHGNNTVICCQFNITLTVTNVTSTNTSSQYVYQLIAYNGVRTFSGVVDTSIENCAVVACLNSSVSSCGTRFSNYSQIVWPVIFNNISISANYTNNENRIQFPNSLLTSIKPIPAQFTTWEKEVSNSTVTRKFSLKEAQSRLLTFGIFGRDFSTDSGNTGSSASISKNSTVLGFVIIFVWLFFKF